MKIDLTPKPWAPRLGFKRCQMCGTTKRPHHARGLCQRCYQRWRYPQYSNRPEVRQRLRRQWRESKQRHPADPDKRREYNRRYYQQHRERILQRARERARKGG